jgi:DNA-binding transcriptional ArsR family regulator
MPAPKKKAEADCCAPTASLTGRLVSANQAAEMAGLFKALANDTRVRLLHALALAGELCVSSLAEAVGMSAQAVSNQLQRLADRGIVRPRRRGNNVYYRIVNPCVTEMLDRGLCLVDDGCRES